jgi:Ca2+-binding EF-hand superfamily protein
MHLSKSATALSLVCAACIANNGANAFVPSALPNTAAQRAKSMTPSLNNIAIATPANKAPMATTALKAADNVDDELASVYRNADATFAIIDVDGGGSLSRAEFAKHLSVSGYNEETIDKIFAKMDVNKDDEISKQEFRDGMVMLTALQSAPGLGSYNTEFVTEICEDADQVFQGADADGNGEIDRDELRSHIGRSFANYSKDAIDEIFRQIDVNSDGTITKEEFREAFIRSSALRQAIGEGPNYK